MSLSPEAVLIITALNIALTAANVTVILMVRKIVRKARRLP